MMTYSSQYQSRPTRNSSSIRACPRRIVSLAVDLSTLSVSGQFPERARPGHLEVALPESGQQALPLALREQGPLLVGVNERQQVVPEAPLLKRRRESVEGLLGGGQRELHLAVLDQHTGNSGGSDDAQRNS